MVHDKHHWYDGWFYDKIIAPHQEKLFGQIKDLIEPDSSVIDVGCGTGRLAFTIAGKCKSVLGIDLSERNINRAKWILGQKPNAKIAFKNSNLTETINGGDAYFDYAVLTYVIHEVDKYQRFDLLADAASVAGKIIVADYLVPGPGDFSGWLSEVIEFIAGIEHYRNYKSYMENGGIHHLANKAGLKIINEISTQTSTNHILILSK